LGSAAPLFAGLADRYIDTHFGSSTGGQFISLLGDAELDEGNVWEALVERLTRKLGNVLWIVDVNRQSLDRVIPGIRAGELEAQFTATGWEVIELKYGRRLRSAFLEPGGELLRRRIDEMPNEQYQSLFGASEEVARQTILDPLDGSERSALTGLLDDYRGELAGLVRDLGGHDMADVLAALTRARKTTDRPTVVFAYTIKGYGLEIAGRPLNHSALLTGEQIDALRAEIGLTSETEWDSFPPASNEGQMLATARVRLQREERPLPPVLPVPTRLSDRDPGRTSTQAAFGRALLELSRSEGLGGRLVTVSPDVSVSTNLGGFINKTGVWGQDEEPAYDAMEDSPLKWRVGPRGQHLEMGIAEMNLVLMLGQLGLTWDFQRERLFPIGTLYDPFVMRALEGIVFSVYQGARFVLCGTPSGISLSREGGAHQSLSTPGIGIETPSLTYCEPAYARELEWLLVDGLGRLQLPDGESMYLRLSTKPLDQAPFAAAVARQGEDPLRADVLAGGFRLREAGQSEDRVLIATCGAMAPEALAAADVLAEDEGVEATVLCLSSPVACTTGGGVRLPRRCMAASPSEALTSTASCAPMSAACRSSRLSTAPRTRSPGSAPLLARAASRSVSTPSARSARSPRSTLLTASRARRLRLRRSLPWNQWRSSRALREGISLDGHKSRRDLWSSRRTRMTSNALISSSVYRPLGLPAGGSQLILL
jgi:pyruvate dehydrogenase E1 component